MDGSWYKFIFYLCLFAVFFIILKSSESQNGMMRSARDSGRVSSYLSYIEKYENGKFVNEAIDSIGAISQREDYFDIVALSEFSVNYYINSKVDSIVAIISQRRACKAC